MKKSVRTVDGTIGDSIDGPGYIPLMDPDIQNWRKGQKWTLRQGFAPIFVPIAPGALDRNGSESTSVIITFFNFFV
jgi:hypothetical protein